MDEEGNGGATQTWETKFEKKHMPVRDGETYGKETHNRTIQGDTEDAGNTRWGGTG